MTKFFENLDWFYVIFGVVTIANLILMYYAILFLPIPPQTCDGECRIIWSEVPEFTRRFWNLQSLLGIKWVLLLIYGIMTS